MIEQFTICNSAGETVATHACPIDALRALRLRWGVGHRVLTSEGLTLAVRSRALGATLASRQAQAENDLLLLTLDPEGERRRRIWRKSQREKSKRRNVMKGRVRW